MASLILNISGLIIMLSIIISFIRLIKGPDYMNRVAAFDSMTIISISLIVYISYIVGRSAYIDVALVYGLLSFLGVIAIAKYSEGGVDND